MQSFSATELISVWERGLGQSAVTQALLLLALAWPESAPETLAKLSVGRRDARLLTVREWLFGSQLGSVVACPQCTQQLELTFHLSQIRATQDGIQPEILVVEADGYTATFRLPNSEDLAAIRTDGRAPYDVATVRRALLRRCLLQVQREEQQAPQTSDESIVELPPTLITAIAEKMEQHDPQANVQLNLSCADCDHQWLATFDIVSYLWNEIDHWARRILWEVHALASAYGWREVDILSMSVQRRQCYLGMVGKTT
jgi:hypothetical protein